MAKGKTQKQSAKATLAEVIKEMAKPRVAMSAREQISVSSERRSLIVKNDVKQ
jgi:TolA-binding protein